MPKNILIDTCVLKELVSKTDYSNYLKQIALWTEHGYATLYVPSVLLEEWEKHKVIEEERIEKVLKQYEGDKKKVALFGLEEHIDIGEAELDYADKRLKSQIIRIDDMLRQGVQIPQGDEEILQTWDHKKKGKAPFINKKESENDALLIFSTLEALTRKGEQELYFFSSNKHEFGSPLAIDTTLHPDIAGVKPGIIVHYFAKLTTGIEALLSKGLPSTRIKPNQLNNIKNVVSVDRKLQLISQLRCYLEKRFDDINFLPEEFFTRHYPFINTDNFRFYPKPFTALTNNDEIIKLFEVETDTFGAFLDQSSVSPDLVWVSQVLRRNLIHHIENGDRKIYDIPLSNISENCCCPRCLFQEFRFGNFFSSFSENNVEYEISLSQAYYLYMAGKFLSAAEVLKEVGKQALNDGRKLTYFISRFNLTTLRRLIEFHAYNEGEYTQIKKELDEIELENDELLVSDNTNNEIIKWIKDKAFEETALETMTYLVHQIREDFYNKNTGFNNHASILLARYFEVESFLKLNFIIYDDFDEFTGLTDVFIEGVIASHACQDILGGKLLFFSDSILERIAWHGRHEHIRKMFRRYKLKSLKYVPDDLGGGFVLMFRNFLNGYQSTVDAYAKFNNEGIDIFWSKYRRYFHNSIILCAVIELDTSEVETLTDSILAFLKVEQHLLEYELTKSLLFYLYQKKDHLTEKQLHCFIWHALTSELVSYKELTKLLTTLARERNFKLVLEPTEWNYFETHYLVETFPKPDGEGMLLICYLYELLAEPVQKKEISKFINQYLVENYHYDIYYLSVIFDIIPVDEIYSERYSNEMLAIAQKGHTPRPFDVQSYYNDSRLDAYINYCFKYGLTLSEPFRQAVMKLDLYYDWVTDMENFDYRQFQMEWLFNYYTKFKRAKYKESTKLQSHWLEMCSKSTNDALLRRYIEVYQGKANQNFL